MQDKMVRLLKNPLAQWRKNQCDQWEMNKSEELMQTLFLQRNQPNKEQDWKVLERNKACKG